MNKLHALICVFLVMFSCSLVQMFRPISSMASGEYSSGSMSMAFVTVPSKEVADKLANRLVSGKLAACVNILPGVTSVYEWEGKIEQDSELLLMIKTRSSMVGELTKFVTENYPYDVPEVISAKIDQGNPQYLKWLNDVVKTS